MRQGPEQEQEWIRQLSLIYSALIGIGVVMVQPFLRLERDRLLGPTDREEPGDTEA